MRLLAFILVAALVLSVARALAIVLILAIAVLIVWALIRRPLELLGLVLLGLLSGALQARPTTTILCVTGLAAIITVRKHAEAQPEVPTDPKQGA